jgi:hypothetical protein
MLDHMGLSNEERLAALVILGIFGLAIYRVVLWLMEAKPTADPWGEEINKAINEEDAVPLCHHCFTPQEHNGWFCPECGATVGPYCNYMPYVYVFAEGEVLRAGVTERFRPRPLIVIGYLLFSLGLFAFTGPMLFAVAAPIYWYFLFKNLRRNDCEKVEDTLVT